MTVDKKVLRCLSAALTILITEKKLDGAKVLTLIDDCNFDELYGELNEVYKVIKVDEVRHEDFKSAT